MEKRIYGRALSTFNLPNRTARKIRNPFFKRARSLERSGKRIYGKVPSTFRLPNRTARKIKNRYITTLFQKSMQLGTKWKSGSTGEHSQPSTYLTEPQGKLEIPFLKERAAWNEVESGSTGKYLQPSDYPTEPQGKLKIGISQPCFKKACSLERSGKRIYGRALSTFRLPNRTARKIKNRYITTLFQKSMQLGTKWKADLRESTLNLQTT